jgi:predicted permease
MKPPVQPPAWADRLLKRLLPADLLGDLHEQFAQQVTEVGDQKARWLYTLEVLRFCRPYFLKRRAAHDKLKMHQFGYYSQPYTLSPDMIRNYVKIAFRKLSKDRQFTFLNLTGLSTGLACTLLLFLWVNDELSVDKFHEKDSQLYRVLENELLENELLTTEQTPYPLAQALVQQMPEVERAVSVNYTMDWFAGKGVASFGQNSVKAQGVFASKDYFNVFSYKLLEGTKELALSTKNGVAISEQLAQKLFNTTKDLVGKPLEWDHQMKFKVPLVISGVFENPPTNASDQFDLVFNFDLLLEGDRYSKDWTGSYSNTTLVLKAGTDIAQFNSKIANFLKSRDPKSTGTLFVEPFSDRYLYSKFKNGVRTGGRIEYVRLFSFTALFILIIACINFTNLTTAQAAQKTKEIGVKKTLGASRQSLVMQFLGESLLLTCLSAVIAVGLVFALLPLFNQITAKQIHIDFNVNSVMALVGVVLVTSFLAGIYPAFYLSGFNSVTVLKGKLPASLSNLFVRQGLVVFQFGISVVFIIGFLVINQQIDYTQTRHLGYNRSNVLTFAREGALRENTEAFLTELKKIAGIERVATMPGSILDGTDRQAGFSWRGQQSDMGYLFKSPRISYDVIETLGMTLVAGRSFSKEFNDDNNDDLKIILNESAAKMMNLKNPVGMTIKHGDDLVQIIGLVKDFQYGSMHQPIEPLIFRFRTPEISPHVILRIKAGTEKAVIAQVKALYEKFHPKYAFEYSFLDADYQKLYATEQRTELLASVFAALAILISCLGLFGLAAFTAQKRQKEIGIRKVVGATTPQIVTLLSQDFLKLVLIAFVLAVPVAWYVMNQWLQGFAYRINIGWQVFALTGALATIVALLTISFQAIKAALMNPVKSLRSE